MFPPKSCAPGRLARVPHCGIGWRAGEMLWQDYQLGVIRNLFIPIWQWRRGIHPGVWWSHLERAFLAYQDLGCEAWLA